MSRPALAGGEPHDYDRRLARPESPSRNQTYLSGVEGGKRNLSIMVLDRIASALNVDVAEFFRRQGR